MQTRLKTTIDPSDIGFRRYIRNIIGNARYEVYTSKILEEYVGVDYERFSEAIKIVDLDDKFRLSLTAEENEALTYMKYHNPGEKMPDNYFVKEQSAYKKWIDIFFKDYDKNCCEINQFRLGILMKKIRNFYNVKMASLARQIGVDVSCVCLYEKGQRLPNLNYMKKFCYLFSISIDELVSLSEDSTFRKIDKRLKMQNFKSLNKNN